MDATLIPTPPRRGTLGSTSGYLVEHAPCPVVTVRSEAFAHLEDGEPRP